MTISRKAVLKWVHTEATRQDLDKVARRIYAMTGGWVKNEKPPPVPLRPGHHWEYMETQRHGDAYAIREWYQHPDAVDRVDQEDE